MIIKGKYTEAIVYADIVDDTTIAQVKELCSQQFMEGRRVRIMADCHAGKGCVIGTTFDIADKIVPNLVGVDIGCGMLTVKLGRISIDLEALDKYIREAIPAGMNVNEEITEVNVDIGELRCYDKLDRTTYLRKSIGSLGGGNHFIELDRDDDGVVYLIIHTGSRNLGKQVCEYYQNLAISLYKNKVLDKKSMINDMIREYKNTGREREISAEIKRISNLSVELDIPEALCYLEGREFDDYIYDMAICQSFAAVNRYEIARRITSFLKLDLTSLESFETIHNYIDVEKMILRKGAISAECDEMVLIPLNMRDGCIIAYGLGNPDYNCSAPHGAGRVMSRGEARRSVTMSEFSRAMEGIYTTSVSFETIDEAPMVYKEPMAIINNIKDTVRIVKIIKPIYNFKAGE